MKIPLIVAAAAALAFTAPISQATVINSDYRSLGGDVWLVDFTVVNDGTPASFAGFSIDFPDASNLVLVSSPSTWDSVVFQQDANLQDDAFLDSFAINPATVWANGSTVGGFEVSFRYTAGATPGALPFMVFGSNFAPLFSGTTVVTVVPEPATGLLVALGLAVVGLRALRNTSKELSA